MKRYLRDLLSALLASALFSLPFVIYFTWMMKP